MASGPATAASNAARAAIRAERVSFYVAIGGPGMPNAAAAALLGVTVKTVSRYRAGLIAAGAVTRRPPGPAPAEPCGTTAAWRRHMRRRETPCPGCRMAAARDRADRPAVLMPDYREKRNDMPDVPLYRWRPRGDRPAYPWAARAIAAAEAVHGAPEPTCLCGGPLPEASARNPHALCAACEPPKPPKPSAPPAVLHFLDGAGEPACRGTGSTVSTTDPRKVTCRVCLRSRALARDLAGRMVMS